MNAKRLSELLADFEKDAEKVRQELSEVKATMVANFGNEKRNPKILTGEENTATQMLIPIVEYYMNQVKSLQSSSQEQTYHTFSQKMKDDILEVLMDLNRGRLAVSQAHEQIFDLLHQVITSDVSKCIHFDLAQGRDLCTSTGGKCKGACASYQAENNK